MLNLKWVWILALLSIVVLGGCAAESAISEPTPLNDSSIVLEDAASPTSSVVATKGQALPISSPIPAATEVDTAVVPTPTGATSTAIHSNPTLPKSTPLNSGNDVDTFLVRNLNTESGTSFEDLAVERSKQHLSQKMQVPIEEITLDSVDRAELDNNNLCQSPTNASKENENHGITLGYEILLRVNNQIYRYVISHNLGYYCDN